MTTLATPPAFVIDPVRGQTLDPADASEGIPMQFPGPAMSSGGLPDELSAAGQRDGWAERFARAHAEADADEARNLLASTELSPAEFKALIERECGPDRRWKVEAWAYVYSAHYGPRADQSRYHATIYAGPDDKRGVPLKAESLRELAGLIRKTFPGYAHQLAKRADQLDTAVNADGRATA